MTLQRFHRKKTIAQIKDMGILLKLPYASDGFILACNILFLTYISVLKRYASLFQVPTIYSHEQIIEGEKVRIIFGTFQNLHEYLCDV